MSVGAFTDKAHPPTTEQVLESIGPKRSAWEELARFMRDEFRAREEFKFYGKNYGWALRFRKSGKAVASLYPADGNFSVQIILGETAAKKARTARLSKRIQRMIEEAHPYPEGRWLFIPVKSARDLKDVERLLELKFETGRSSAPLKRRRTP